MVLDLQSRLFTQLIEHNQHEGQSWSFWLQVDGNEDALHELEAHIINEDLEEEYEFTGVTIYEWELDTLVNYGNFGYDYMNQHHKVAGKLKLPNGFQANDIYKGGIRDFYKES